MSLDQKIPNNLVQNGLVAVPDLHPKRHEILKQYLRGQSLSSIAAQYNVKTHHVRKLCHKMLREYRVRNDQSIKTFLADLNAKIDMCLERAWEICDECQEDGDKIKAIDVVNRVLASQLGVARLLAPTDSSQDQTFVDCTFVVVKDRTEKERVTNKIIDAKKLENIARPTHEIDGTFSVDSSDLAEAERLP